MNGWIRLMNLKPDEGQLIEMCDMNKTPAHPFLIHWHQDYEDRYSYLSVHMSERVLWRKTEIFDYDADLANEI